MNSEDSDSEEGKDALLPQVVDYYKKYSQSRRLPAYFRGSTVSKIEECVAFADGGPQRVGQDENVRVESPESSVASKSRLEWDNGADIGYENAEPTQFSPEGQKTDLSPLQQQTSSESADNNQVVCADSLDSNYDVKSDSDVEKQNTVYVGDSLKRKIGVPLAESTPFERNEDVGYVETPRRLTKNKRSTSCEDMSSSKSGCTVKKWSSQQDFVETRSMPLKRIIKLCPTKPTVIECLSAKSKKDKYTQTSLTRNASAGVQTDLETNREVVRSSERTENVRSGIIYSQHSDLENSVNKNSSATQTDSEACVSKCNSFEYLYGETYDRNQEKPALKRTEAKTNLAENENGQGDGSSSDAKSSLFLTKKLSLNDLDRTIGLIQKLVNSKRYDDVTKRYYLKKIVEKIVNNCKSTEGSEKELGKSSERNTKDEQYLQNNIPWQPVGAPKKSELKMQTFCDEFVPETGSSENSAETKKKSPFTLCGDRRDKKISEGTARSSSGDVPNATDTYSSTPVDDWREQKTLSERLFEEQKRLAKSQSSSSSGDNLVSFAKKERQNQLTWINNEIVHLNKLKKLLEDKKRTDSLRNVASCALKPHVEDMARRKKSTTVYMITTEKSDESSGRDSHPTATRIPRYCSCSHHTYPSFRQATTSSPNTAGTCSLSVSNRYKPPPSVPSSCQCVANKVPFDLKNARLVSNEVFTTKSDKGNTTTAVSRYTFEIPIEKEGLVLKRVNNVEVGTKSVAATKPPCKCCGVQFGTCPPKETAVQAPTPATKEDVAVLTSPSEVCRCCAAQTNTCIQKEIASQSLANAKSELGVVAAAPAADSEVQAEPLREEKQAEAEEEARLQEDSFNQFPETSDKELKTDAIPSEVSAAQAQPTQVKRLSQTEGSLKRLPTRNASSLAHLMSTREQGVSCGCCMKDAGCQCDLQGGTVVTEGLRKESVARNSAVQTRGGSGSSGRDSRDAQAAVNLDNGKVDGGDLYLSVSEASTSSSSTTASSEGSSGEFWLCPCCRLNKVALPSERSVADSKSSPNYILCYPCYQQCEKTTEPGTRPYFTYPGHVCNCYTLLKTSALNQIRKTVQDLERIEKDEDCCKCAIGKDISKNKEYCEYCNCKLQKVRKGGTGIAYTLTIEKGSPKPETPQNVKNLPEIKIKVPDTHSRKDNKDKENQRKVSGGKSPKKEKKKKNHNQTSSLTIQVQCSSVR